MKKILLATIGSVALLGMAVPAFAADMAVKARPAPVVVPIYDWTGGTLQDFRGIGACAAKTVNRVG